MLRCLSNLLVEETDCEVQIQDERLLIALFLILQCFLQQHPFIVQECLWLLNNLTGECPTGLSAEPELLLGPALIAGRLMASCLQRPPSQTLILLTRSFSAHPSRQALLLLHSAQPGLAPSPAAAPAMFPDGQCVGKTSPCVPGLGGRAGLSGA